MTRYLRVGKNPRRVLPPTTVFDPVAPSNAVLGDWTEYGSGAATSHSVPLPGGIQSGDLLVALMQYEYFSGGDISGTPTGWTKENAADSGYDTYTVVFYRVCNGTEGSTETFTFSTASLVSMVVGRFTGSVDWSTYPPESSIGATSDPYNAPDPPSFAPSHGSGTYWIIAGWGASRRGVGDLTVTPPSGYTLRATAETSLNKECNGAATQQLSGTTFNPGAFSIVGINVLNTTNGITIAVPSNFGSAALATGDHTHNVNDADDVGTGATTKGDILVHDGTDYERLAVGSNDQVLTADSAQSLGVKWATAAGGASALNDLTDVTITAATTGEVLQYNGSAWVDAGLPLTDLSNVTISSAVTGEVLKYNGSIWVNDTDDTGSGLPSASAKGDIAVYNGSSWVIRAVGSNDQVLTADSAQSDGVKWATAGGSGWDGEATFTDPPSTGWSWVNQGSSTIATETGNALTLYAPSAGANNLTGRVRSYTASDTAVARISCTRAGGSNGGYGLWFRESSSGKLHAFYVKPNGQITMENWNSPTSYSSNPFAASYAGIQQGWLKLEDNSTNLLFSMSSDGYNFLQIGSVARTSFMSGGPDEWGFFVRDNSSNHYVTVHSWA